MTRTITTAAELDALPVGAGIVDKHGDLGLIDRGVMRGVLIVRYAETDVMSVRRAARYLPMTVVHDPSEARPESAPVVPVVSDAAVEAAARAMAGVVSVGKDYWRATARLALRAALPHLAAVPSATREDVEYLVRTVDGRVRDVAPIIADVLVANLTITPRTDR